MSLNRACSVWAFLAVIMCSAPAFGGVVGGGMIPCLSIMADLA